MSYAGTYGSDETCRHDNYWRSCPFCNAIGPRATEKQIAEHEAKRRREIAEAEAERVRLAAQRSDDLVTLRTTAAAMRRAHGQDHPRHEFWSATAAWLEQAAVAGENGPRLQPIDTLAVAVARAYTEAE